MTSFGIAYVLRLVSPSKELLIDHSHILLRVSLGGVVEFYQEFPFGHSQIGQLVGFQLILIIVFLQFFRLGQFVSEIIAYFLCSPSSLFSCLLFDELERCFDCTLNYQIA